MPDNVVIRPTLALRLFTLAFAIVWFGFLAAGLVRALRDGRAVVIAVPILMMVGGVLIFRSNLRMRVIADAQGLRVRNFVREHRYPIGDVDRFVEHGPNGMPERLGALIAVLLTDGRMIDLRVTTTGPLGRARRAHVLRTLRAWLDGERGRVSS